MTRHPLSILIFAAASLVIHGALHGDPRMSHPAGFVPPEHPAPAPLGPAARLEQALEIGPALGVDLVYLDMDGRLVHRENIYSMMLEDDRC